MIFKMSSISVIMHCYSFLILLIGIFFSMSFIWFCFGFIYLVDFSTEFDCFLQSIPLVCVRVFAFFCSRAFQCAVMLLVSDLCNFFMKALSAPSFLS